MTIEEFLKQFVEEYLFCDLENMAAITLPLGKNNGAASYPIVATILSGMELLGALLMQNTTDFKPLDGAQHFKNYWNNYFVIENPKYRGLHRFFRQLMRHGISHVFVAKPGIFIAKDSGKPTFLDQTNMELFLDCKVFLEEFERSYENQVIPVLGSKKSNKQLILNRMSSIYSKDSMDEFGKLSNLDPSLYQNQTQILNQTTTTTSSSSGASLPLDKVPRSSGTPSPFVTTPETKSNYSEE